MSAPGKRIGVLGGTFDPVHLGHLAAASEVHHALGLDRVLLVPTHAQPFKEGQGAASSHDRLEMCRLAVQSDARFAVSSVDIDRGGVTYTIDTLTELGAIYPRAQLFFITGADALARLDEWKDVDQLMSLATFVGVGRPGHTFSESSRPHILVETPAMTISSSDVRHRVGGGRPIRYLVPERVANYIEANGLYHGGMDD